MNHDSPGLHGMQGLYNFAPADFLDADDTRPTAAVFDLGGNGNSAPYTAAMNGMILKHIDEIKQKTAATLSLPSGWKKRLRDFLSQKNTDLLDFLSLSIPSHPTLGKGEAILRKFGNINIRPDHPTVKDLVLDSSGADVISEISNTILSMRKDDGLKDHVNVVRFIFEQYREAGEEALKQESRLKEKLASLDKIQGRLAALFELDPTEQYAPLMEATEAYLKGVFEKNEIKEQYWAFIAAYRRYIALRDIVMMTRSVHSQENEPLCTVCLADPVMYATSPCGHTYCQTCMKKQTTTCFMCRGTIRDKVRLYFG